VLVAGTIQQQNANQLSINGRGYSSDLLLQDPLSAATSSIGGSNQTEYKYNALFSRLGYVWDEKYILNLSARRDGSSRFGSANEFHNFGAIAGGWVFSNEGFLKDDRLISFGKLTASYGTTGNDQIGDYSFLSLYNSVSYSAPYQGIPVISPRVLTNPFLQWEETKKTSIGLDLGFLKDRILLNAIWFENRSSNQLVSYPLPSITGFTGITENMPATVQNTGIELSINTINVKSKDFNWSTSFNLTVPQNKLVAFPNLANTSYASTYVIGKPIINISKVYHFMGVNPATGLYQFLGSNGNLTSNPVFGQDNTVFISQSPKYYGGLENSFSYKGFDLSFLFQFVKQTGTTDPFGSIYPGRISSNQGNEPVWILDRWQKPGDQATIQLFGTDQRYSNQVSAANNSDAYYTDASYIRLKNVALSYRLPINWLNKAHLQSLQIYLQAQNLLTITKYKGLDPENPQGVAGLPPLRVITMGIRIGL